MSQADLMYIHDSTTDTSFLYMIWIRHCCSALQCVAVCCSVLQCVAVINDTSYLYRRLIYLWDHFCHIHKCHIYKCQIYKCHIYKCQIYKWDESYHTYSEICHRSVAVLQSVLQCVTVCCSVLQCVALCCSVHMWWFVRYVTEMNEACHTHA